MTKTNKVAVITGATGGIGIAFAKHFAALGYDLMLSAYESDKLLEIAKAISAEHDIEVKTIHADLSIQEDIIQLVHELGKLPCVDVLVNCAGFGERSFFYKEDIAVIRRMLSVHVNATVELVHGVLPGMIARRSGDIVIVSSLAAFIPAPGSSIYASTKAFLNSFAESVHMEVAELGIKVQSLCPGLTHTEFHKGSDVEKSIAIKGVDLWMEADEVVKASMEGLESGDVICIPGCINKAIKAITPSIPRRLYYAIADRASDRFK